MDCPHTISARYYAQITSTQYRPSGLRSRPTVSAHARVALWATIAAGLVVIVQVFL